MTVQDQENIPPLLRVRCRVDSRDGWIDRGRELQVDSTRFFGGRRRC